MPIPSFDHNLVIPPHLGDPTQSDQLSPFHCTTIELCSQLGTSSERRRILKGFLDFRERLQNEGLLNGFQWIDGSFLEDVEKRDGRPPKDIDVVTVYWGYDLAFQASLASRFPEIADSSLSKAGFLVDHYPLDASHSPLVTLEWTRYWTQLFSHNRDGVWKGMLQIDLNTAADDAQARKMLGKATP